MSASLAQLLTDTAAAPRRPPRAQARRHRAHLRGARRGRARASPGCCKRQGRRSPATASGSCCRTSRTSPVVYYGILRAGGVVVPMNVLLKGREVSFYLERLRGEAPVRLARLRARPPSEGAEEAGAEADPASSPASSSRCSATRRAAPRTCRARRRRHRGDPLHVGHDRHAEGRRADARQPVQATPRSPAATLVRRSPRTTSSSARCRCSTRSARRAALNVARRAPAPTLTLIPRFDPGKALEIIERDGVTIFEGVPTMYHALLTTPSATTTTSRACGCASRAAGDAGRGHAGLRGGVRLQDPRGLRPVRDLAGRVVQPPRHASASRARSARRSRASR